MIGGRNKLVSKKAFSHFGSVCGNVIDGHGYANLIYCTGTSQLPGARHSKRSQILQPAAAENPRAVGIRYQAANLRKDPSEHPRAGWPKHQQ